MLIKKFRYSIKGLTSDHYAGGKSKEYEDRIYVYNP
jgi:hypothetical protein